MTARITTIACLLCLACTYYSFAQCPDDLSVNNGLGTMTLFFPPNDIPTGLLTIDVNFGDGDMSTPNDLIATGITVTPVGNKYQTIGNGFDNILLTGQLTMKFISGPDVTCGPYDNGALQIAAPVDLIDWDGHLKSDDIELRWSTAWEENNAGFEIERSFDGQGFERIGMVAGNGTSELENYYSYIDEDIRTKALGTIAYYRLAQIDFDGSKTFSDVIAIDLELDYSDFEITKVTRVGISERSISVYYYNPPSVQKVNLLVSNIQGNILMQSSLRPTPGINIVEINLGYNPDNLIFLSMDNGRKVIQEKIVLMDMR